MVYGQAGRRFHTFQGWISIAVFRSFVQIVHGSLFLVSICAIVAKYRNPRGL